MLNEGGEAEAIARDRGMIQVNDDTALRQAVQTVLVEHKNVADEYRGGKESSLQFLVGMSMKAMKGAGNPAALRDILVEELAK